MLFIEMTTLSMSAQALKKIYNDKKKRYDFCDINGNVVIYAVVVTKNKKTKVKYYTNKNILIDVIKQKEDKIPNYIQTPLYCHCINFSNYKLDYQPWGQDIYPNIQSKIERSYLDSQNEDVGP
jgi:hypothetical protein